MQMLAQIETGGFDDWKQQFDARAEDRGGMTMMQMWHDADASGCVFVLFDVHDRKRAESWAKGQAALGSDITVHFLRTV